MIVCTSVKEIKQFKDLFFKLLSIEFKIPIKEFKSLDAVLADAEAAQDKIYNVISKIREREKFDFIIARGLSPYFWFRLGALLGKLEAENITKQPTHP